MAHQAAEKALKAAVLAVTREYPPMTHNLRTLAQRTGLTPPDDVLTAMLRLAPHYTASRYPDVSDGPPELAYNRAIALELLRASDEVREWATKLCTPHTVPEGEEP